MASVVCCVLLKAFSREACSISEQCFIQLSYHGKTFCATDSVSNCVVGSYSTHYGRRVFTLLQVYKETSKRALDEQFGGEDETPPPAPGFTSPTLKLTKYSNAYMLVYIRESSWKDIMRDVPEEDIAEHVRSRLKVPHFPLTLCCACHGMP